MIQVVRLIAELGGVELIDGTLSAPLDLVRAASPLIAPRSAAAPRPTRREPPPAPSPTLSPAPATPATPSVAFASEPRPFAKRSRRETNAAETAPK